MQPLHKAVGFFELPWHSWLRLKTALVVLREPQTNCLCLLQLFCRYITGNILEHMHSGGQPRDVFGLTSGVLHKILQITAT
ncbi:hypothetical protein WJ45_06785 [Burkholderia ubonensis]|nr:hypothetical protein WJ45_06785 [Burkholderia ubonensis]KVQ48029.1 hypothetical protein WK04_10000 [Burkholderia ubonensis]